MRRQLAAVLLGAALALAAVDLFGLLQLLDTGMTSRPVAVARLSGFRTGFNAARASRIMGPQFHSGTPAQLLQRVGDFVGKVEADPSDRLEDIYARAAAGGGLYCAGMSQLFFNALRLSGYQARIVQLRRSVFNPWDSHATVEVLVDGSWQLWDPTFNVVFERAGRRVGAEEIARALIAGSAGDIQPVSLGQVRYPARIEGYRPYWLTLFNNVLITDGRTPPRLLGLPPLRFWFGPRDYYTAEWGDVRHIRTLARLYFLFVGLLPILVMALGLTGLVLLVGRRPRGAQPPRSGAQPLPVAAEAR